MAPILQVFMYKRLQTGPK